MAGLQFASTANNNKYDSSIPVCKETPSKLECYVDRYRTYVKQSSPSSNNLKLGKNNQDMKNNARRRLFGSTNDRSATKADLASMRQALSQQDRARWGFNFESGQPCRLEAECRYIWERVTAECCVKENIEWIMSTDYYSKSVTASPKLTQKTNEICLSLSPANNTVMSSNLSSPHKLMTSSINSPSRKPLCDSTDIIMNQQNSTFCSPRVLLNSELIVETSPASNNRLSLSCTQERIGKVKRQLNLGEGSSNNEASKRVKLGNDFSHSSNNHELQLHQEFQKNELLQGRSRQSQQLWLDQALNNGKSIQLLMPEQIELEQEAANVSQQQFNLNLQQQQMQQQDESLVCSRSKAKLFEGDKLQNNCDNYSIVEKSIDSNAITSTKSCNRNQDVPTARSNVSVINKQAVPSNAVVNSSDNATSVSEVHTPVRDELQLLTRIKISANRSSNQRKRINSVNAECHTITEYYPAKKSRVNGSKDNQGRPRRYLNL